MNCAFKEQNAHIIEQDAKNVEANFYLEYTFCTVQGVQKGYFPEMFSLQLGLQPNVDYLPACCFCAASMASLPEGVSEKA